MGKSASTRNPIRTLVKSLQKLGTAIRVWPFSLPRARASGGRQRGTVTGCIGMYTFIAIPWVLGSVAIGVLALRRSRAARANGVWWCIGASLERLLPIIELNKEFSDFFFDPNRERLRSWQLAFFAVY